MRTATRIALVLTGTAILIAAMATHGAQADRSRIKGNRISALTAQQRARPQPRPDRIEYVQAADVMSVATAIAHLSAAPEVANFRRGEGWVASEVALTRDMNQAAKTSLASPTICDGDTFAAQQRNASDGGRGAVADHSQQASCLKDGAPKRRTRQAIVGDLDGLQVQTPEAAPVVFKFEAAIRIDLAGLNW